MGGALALAVVTVGAGLSVIGLTGSSGGASLPEPGGFRADVGAAGPLGPAAFSAVPSYWKRVTFATDQLGQYQDIAAHLPAGTYLVKVATRAAAGGGAADCMGLAFALAPSAGSFSGYVVVPHDGDATTVLCYDEATTSTSTATFDVFYTPVKTSVPATASHEEHS